MVFQLAMAFRALIARFRHHKAGSIAPVFALAAIPVMTGVGAAVDYSRASNVRSSMQAALDAGMLAGAMSGSSNWSQVAGQIFNSNLEKKALSGMTFATSFAKEQGLIYKGRASTSVPTAFLGILRVSSLNVAVNATAVASEPDNSCILTLDHGQPASHVSLTLNGAPIVNLSGCSIRSNTSLNCNGHDGNVTKAISAGGASGCGNPRPNSSSVPDIYAALATNITAQCGGLQTGVTWTAGSIPAGPAIKTVTNNGRTEYHVCGSLTLTGTGSLLGYTPAADALLVIENGSLNVANNASVSVLRMAVVLTGDNSVSSSVNFPNGNGQQAKLTLSPPLEVSNPWQGVALYQDPKLTKNIDNKWGPGADFSADGLVYLGNSNVVTDGNTSSSNAKCSKFVMNSFTTNGKVSLDFDQSVTSCAAIGLKQWGGIIVHLTQ